MQERKKLWERIQTTVEHLLNDAQDLVKTKFCNHVFNIRHLFCSLKSLRDNLQTNEIILHVDFSENYYMMHVNWAMKYKVYILEVQDTRCHYIHLFCIVLQTQNHSVQFQSVFNTVQLLYTYLYKGIQQHWHFSYCKWWSNIAVSF